jgi:deoxyribodipyrimidine photolyase-related protein
MTASRNVRRIVVIFGDQLDEKARVLRDMDREKDLVWMAESFKEATHVWSNKHRIALFFSAMRHFAARLGKAGYRIHYRELDDQRLSLGESLAEDLGKMKPEAVRVTLPGEWRVLKGLKKVCQQAGVELEVLPDDHFYERPEAFQSWAEGRKSIRLEYYYRELRKRHQILVSEDGKPEGEAWNFDKENRGTFGKEGPPGDMPAPLSIPPDAITREVIQLVEAHFPDHPGDLNHFTWAVSREDAQRVLKDFLRNRLPLFGKYQDALWTGEPWLYHSLLSSALNLKLLNPREVVDGAVGEWRSGRAPIEAVEGFVRQILGWREYVRGLYWWKMPGYLKLNALEAGEPLPAFYWNGETPYTCLKESLGQTLAYGYAHHIQRLMVTGLFSLLLGVKPKDIHEWYLAVYVDAVEWVELPNTLGMSQYADGGLMASKPYAATGKYLKRMSNYCEHCPANPDKATGDKACPFTTLYWDFLDRNRKRLEGNQRLALQLKNLDRKSEKEMVDIRKRAKVVRDDPSGQTLFASNHGV